MMKGMVFADRYRLVDFIGQGGMALVYRAVDIRTGHSVAIKILKSEYNSDKEFLERFQREAEAASRMSHHNIVNLLDVGVEGDHRYLVLEYVSGNTLKTIIQQKGRLNTNTAIQITIRILSALQHAHDNGIIHRDIKPQNVLVHSDGHIKVADFGIARMTNALTISKGDTVVGSVHYSSPEQASGSVVEATSDIYSTGVVLYEMLTGRVPFVGDTPVSVAMQHINTPPPPIADLNPDVPPAVVAVVMKALEKNPKKRYQSAREMADALVKARDGKTDPTSEQEVAAAAPKAGKQTDTGRRPVSQSSGRRAAAHRKRATAAMLTTFMVLAVFAALIIGVTLITEKLTQHASTPDVVGLSATEAESQLKREGLVYQVIEEVNHDTVPAGYVIKQVPDADTELNRGDTVLVTLSKGPNQVAMPNLVGLTKEEAIQRIKDRGLTMVGIKVASTEPVGTVISQTPATDTLCLVGREVEVELSGGSTMVPDLVGVTYEQAKATLAESTLTAAKPVYEDVADEAQIGLVIAQAPAAGTLAMLDAPITLTVGRRATAYHGSIEFTVPQAVAKVVVRVVLLEGDKVSEQYSQSMTPETDTVITVDLGSDLPGPLTCVIYIDDVPLEEREVTLE